MMFGLLMGMHLGLAKYSKREGLSDAGKHIFLAFFLPVLWHTIFDSVTTVNPALNSNDDIIQMVGIIVALIVMAISITLQFVLLIRFKKKTAEYCGMMVTDPEPEDVYRNGEENG
jgi:RsiW-degrading membrane proteinase PrsW (M82 family)